MGMIFRVFAFVLILALLIASNAGAVADMVPAFRQQIEADWAEQESHKERSPDDPAAIADAIRRTEALLENLSAMPDAPDLGTQHAALADLRTRAARFESLNAADRLSLYRDIRWLAREAALRNPLIAGRPLVFMQRRRFICQMLHEYLGYYFDYGDIDGGGVFILEKPGLSTATRDLIDDRLPRGNYTTLALSYDAKTLYFGFAERAPEKPDFYSPDRRCFHIFAMNADGSNLRQLTEGPDDDFDPCPLPDGGIAFMSSRRGGFVRCNNPWEPLPTYTLHRMDPDGSNARTLSFHETPEWHPSVLNDGRIVYIRWDYVDRSAANFHGLWTSNPDGTNPVALFGNYTMRINACYQPRPIPGSRRILFVAGAHHADVGGSLVILDPDRARLDAESGENRFESLEVLTPEVCFPEAPGWPDTYYHSPWPLSEDYFLVSYSHDPLPGMGPNVNEDTETGIYLMDRFGNLELLYRQPGISCMYPIPLQPRPVPPVIASSLDPALGDEGEYMVRDIHRSLQSLPGSRRVTALRIFQVLPKSETHIANQPRLGYANAESARMLLGTVPVEPDGSARFRAPAGKPIYFQAVDAEGRAVQSMRSVTYLQPGERRGCVGCHEPRGDVSPIGEVQAMKREPSRIEPGPDGTRPWSFPRLVQPVLDTHCVRCHDGAAGEGKAKPVLTAEPTETFSRAYDGLKPYVRWHEWGGATIDPIATRPGRIGADMSPLLGVLEDEIHREAVALSESDRRRLSIWLDGNASFYGAYSEAERAAQRRGEAIPPPTLQ